MNSALIIEDELPASERLSRLLHDCQIAVLAVVRSNAEAVRWLSANEHPDVIFADIALRDGQSFEALQQAVPRSAIIMVTAYSEFGLEAFAHGAVDYLLKPLTREKLVKSLENIDRKVKLLTPIAITRFRTGFLVASGAMLRKISITDVSHFSSENNVTQLHSGGRAFPVAPSLEKLVQELDPGFFFRISRKAVVNRDHICGISGKSVILCDGNALDISRARHALFVTWLKK